jgi:hypothetical protein
MKKREAKIGGTYAVRMGDVLVPVRLDRESRYGGWEATNLRTSRQIRIKTAQRLRFEVEQTPEGKWVGKGNIR